MSFQAAPASKSSSLWRRISRNWGLYLLLLPAVVILLLFTYQPMVGIVIAFKDFTPAKGIFESPWAGMKYVQAGVDAGKGRQVDNGRPTPPAGR